MENSKIRILVVFGAIANGGVEHIISDIFSGLDSDRFESEAVYHKGCDELDNVPILKNVWKDMEAAPQFMTINALSYRKWWKDYISRHGHFDIVHLNYIDSAFAFVDLFNKAGSITIGHAHNPKSRPYTIGQLVSDIISYPVRFICKYVMACSNQTALELFGKKHANSSKCYILRNGIDLNSFKLNPISRNEIRNQYKANDKTIIGHVGRFAPQKNHEFIITVFAEYYKSNPNSELWLIGEGELQSKIRDNAENLNISNAVRFIGVVNNVHEYMNAFDVFLFPSNYEGLGIVLIEAQSTGLPCIISDAIPDEADIKAGLITRLDTKMPLSAWCNAIDEAKGIERRDCTDYASKAGYNIDDNSKWIESVYLSMLKESK